MMKMEAADWSKFQGPHSSADMLALKNAGIELVIVGSWHGDAHGVNPSCLNDLRLAREARLHTATYTVLDSPQDTTAAGAVQKARQVCASEWEHLSFVAIDVEVSGITIPEIAVAITEVERMGQRPIIYTARWFHDQHPGLFDNFGDIPLWAAQYDDDPNIATLVRFGPWWLEMNAVGKQYTGTTTFAGVEMDRNSFLQEFVVQENREEDGEDMYALIIKRGEEQGTSTGHRTYLWRSGSPALLHMKSRAQREQTALLFGISDSAIVVSQATLDAL